MRIWLAVACVSLFEMPAHADPRDEDLAFVDALKQADAAALGKAITVPFHHVGLMFKSAACGKAFAGDKTVTDKKVLPQLAKCLADLKLGGSPKVAPQIHKFGDSVNDVTCTSEVIVDGDDLTITLAVADAHPFKITGLKLERIDGVIGGVVGDDAPRAMCSKVVMTAPPPPPPPPPRAAPLNVSPVMLEKNRIAGTSLIGPDEATKQAIVASKKEKIVGSFKLCIDDRGAVTQVVQLKSTGFPAYDTAIRDGMRTWAYQPYIVNGAAVPVCTAVTFIYSTR